ncbi:putative FAD-linked oxidoreductase YgaK [Propionispora sp. 2/2-37]|uniref:FAD-binding oxidoreductase n=1 Tax=Propionispora sp. 2/2-37 TaxID=1677858 RepID=UPI0006BB5B24|nr:FAD-binding oxidoreductase [Propionispora sp. 2/2-37]CUH96606.1 putative FAD-linked oxidoreductase YgaK [Propionispora sp. 2/2-37]
MANSNTRLTGRVIFPDDPGYEKARMDFNTRFSKYPCVIVFCQRAQDVINAVQWARENHTPLRARCGGHSYEAFSLLNQGIVIDVSEMDKIFLEKRKGMATIQAGATLLPLYKALWRKGVTIPGGTCPTVGISGLTLGGGFGMLTRKMGLLCDNLMAIQMVNAQGEIIYADQCVNADLFWASRGGGGGNFGIVTSFVFKVHPISNVAVYTITWDWSDAREVIKTWQDWAPFVDERLTSILELFTKKDGRISSSGEFLGSENQLHYLLRPLTAAGKPIQIKVQTIPYIKAVLKFDGGPGPHKFKNTGAFVYRSLSDEAIGTLLYYMEISPNNDNSIQFQSLKGAVSEVPPDGTAYFHREASYIMQYITQWKADNEECPNICWVEKLRQSMLRYVDGTYVNWPDLSIKDWPCAYYGTNYQELMRIKRKYDPENIFHFEQSICPD